MPLFMIYYEILEFLIGPDIRMSEVFAGGPAPAHFRTGSK